MCLSPWPARPASCLSVAAWFTIPSRAVCMGDGTGKGKYYTWGWGESSTLTQNGKGKGDMDSSKGATSSSKGGKTSSKHGAKGWPKGEQDSAKGAKDCAKGWKGGHSTASAHAWSSDGWYDQNQKDWQAQQWKQTEAPADVIKRTAVPSPPATKPQRKSEAWKIRAKPARKPKKTTSVKQTKKNSSMLTQCPQELNKMCTAIGVGAFALQELTHLEKVRICCFALNQKGSTKFSEDQSRDKLVTLLL
jgi:hypothetical protein